VVLDHRLAQCDLSIAGEDHFAAVPDSKNRCRVKLWHAVFGS
jgi:hypothetical protein